MTDEFNPLVSIIIPVYNGSNYMRESIDSAIAQTYTNIEVIVINDGSKDNGETDKIAKSYGNKIRYYSKDNGGVSSALNYGISQMHGTYFSWLSHDDIYLPQKIEAQVNVLAEYKDEKLIAYCGTRQIDKNGDYIGSPANQTNKNKFVLNWEDALIDMLDSGCYSGCAFLIPKQAFVESGKFDESLRYSQDLLMWIYILLNHYKIAIIPEAYVCSRLHAGQLTQTGRDLFRKDAEIMADLLVGELAEKSTNEHNFILSYAKYNAKYKNKKALQKCINEANKYRLLSSTEKYKIKLLSLYGIVRPAIRRLYYKFFRKIKTQ